MVGDNDVFGRGRNALPRIGRWGRQDHHCFSGRLTSLVEECGVGASDSATTCGTLPAAGTGGAVAARTAYEGERSHVYGGARSEPASHLVARN
jgi:hypothetical protein